MRIKSRSRLAADWFAKLRLNAATQEVEHEDVIAEQEAIAAAEAKIASDIAAAKELADAEMAAAIAEAKEVADAEMAAAIAGATMASNDILTSIKTVDGSGSGLDADLLDGNDSTTFAKKTDYASSTTGGTVKLRVNGSALYITTNGSNA